MRHDNGAQNDIGDLCWSSPKVFDAHRKPNVTAAIKLLDARRRVRYFHVSPFHASAVCELIKRVPVECSRKCGGSNSCQCYDPVCIQVSTDPGRTDKQHEHHSPEHGRHKKSKCDFGPTKH